MSPPVRIYTWASTDEALPADRRAIARLQMQMQGKGGKIGWDWSPVVISAETEDAARAKAQAWFDDQVAAEERKRANAQARAEAMRNRRAGAL